MIYYSQMFPVLINIGSFPVSSFGLFLALGIFLGAFTVWRISKGYDLDPEKILDLVFLTIGAGLIFARVGFVTGNLSVFDSLQKILFLNRYPGLLFWGGFSGSILALWWFTKRFKIPYFQAGDVAMVGFLLGAFFAQIGCLLAGCGVGIPSDLFFAVDQAGVIGKRFPVQAFEGFALLAAFFIFWRTALKFYVLGSIFAKGLIYLSIVKILSAFFKAQSQIFLINGISINLDLVFPAIFLAYGLRLYYKVNKKTPQEDLISFFKLITDPKSRKSVVTKIRKGWYNQKVNFWVKLGRGKRRLFKLLNIRSNPESFQP